MVKQITTASGDVLTVRDVPGTEWLVYIPTERSYYRLEDEPTFYEILERESNA